MNYESLISLILVLLVIISFSVHYQQRTKNKKKSIVKYIILKKNQTFTPPGKGFAEYIPPARKCDPETGCHVGSYVDFSTTNL